MRASLLLAASAALLLALIRPAFASASAPASVTCSDDTTELSCLNDGCNWCKCAAVPSSCKDYNAAKILPPSIFSCGNATRPDCKAVGTDDKSCWAAVGCSWCASKTVPSFCMAWANASKLPKSVFNCTIE